MFVPDSSGLPQPGAEESLTLDFKAKYDLARDDIRHEMAKDAAALANASGGRIVVGAASERGAQRDKLKCYVPLCAVEAANTKRGFEEAARDLCIPVPMVNIQTVRHPPGEIVTVDVHPNTALIGVKSRADGDGYRFPKRVGTQTKYLNPDQFAMQMVPELRRIEVLLSAIRPQEPVVFASCPGLLPGPPGSTEAQFAGVHPEANAFGLYLRGGLQLFPISSVVSVWRSAADVWVIAVRGSYFEVASRREWSPF